MKTNVIILFLLFMCSYGYTFAQIPPAQSYYDSIGVKKIKERYVIKNGQKNGKYILYSKEGKILEQGEYLSDKKNGYWKEGYQNGLYREGKYLNGKREGIWKNSKVDISQMRFEFDSTTEFEVVLITVPNETVEFVNGKVKTK